MKHLKNNSYGMGGKLSKQEARLLKMLMTKMMGEEGMRVMQDGGMTPSLAQRLVDEISQVGAGLRSLGNVGSFSQGYGMQEAEDRARTAQGRAGKTDATLAGLSAAIDEIIDDDKSQRRLEVPGAQADPVGRFNRAFDRARMTTEEREAAELDRISRGGISGGQLAKKGGDVADLLTLLERDKIKMPGR